MTKNNIKSDHAACVIVFPRLPDFNHGQLNDIRDKSHRLLAINLKIRISKKKRLLFAISLDYSKLLLLFAISRNEDHGMVHF